MALYAPVNYERTTPPVAMIPPITKPSIMRLIRGVVMAYKFSILLYQLHQSVMRFMLGQWY